MRAIACLQELYRLRRLLGVKHAFFVGAVLLFSAVQAIGCEATPMTLRKVSRDVTVLVTHRDMPIAGITVSVLPENHSEPVFIGNTDSRGIVVIQKLSFGKYFVTAVHDGLEAGKDWIEVVAKPDSKTVKRLTFEWADWSYETSRVEGTLTGHIPGNTGNKLLDIARPVETVYPGVDLTLTGAFSDDEYQTISDSSGTFLFGEVPNGIYLLRIAGGMKSVSGVGDITIIVLDVKRTSKRDSLPLQLKDTGCYRREFELADGG